MAFNFNEKISNENSTLIVDALNLAFRWKHQGKTVFKDSYIATVESLASSYQCSNIIITADEGSSSYRKRILPEYKQNRKDKYAQQSEEEAQAFREFFTEYENTLLGLKEHYIGLRASKVEADDLAAYIVKHREKYNFGEIVLISSDKDWDLLVQDGVMRFSYVTRKEITVDNWKDFYEVSRDQYACYKCLIGDKGDNIPGFTGIGPKRAASLLHEYGSAYNIYDSIPLAGKYKYIEEINKDPEKILRNYELMDLLTHCEDAIGPYHLEDIERRLG